MCHLLLLLPLLMLPVFWLSPASVAVPVYAAAGLVSGIVCWYALKSARMPKLNGAEAMLGATYGLNAAVLPAAKGSIVIIGDSARSVQRAEMLLKS